MELSVYNQEGKDTGRKLSLDASIFGIEPNEHAIYLDVKQHLANKRQGTHKTKERGEISRTTKKAYRQKGTGNARVGSLRSPLQRGGGTIFGPKPHSYSFKLNKKLKRLARRSALSMKASENAITLVDKLSFDGPKTKEFANVLKAFEIQNIKTLIILDEADKNIYLSSRNFQGSDVVTLSELNTYRLMGAQKLMFTEASAGKIKDLLSD
jgi:large subunit ribosomal protein L4